MKVKKKELNLVVFRKIRKFAVGSFLEINAFLETKFTACANCKSCSGEL